LWKDVRRDSIRPRNVHGHLACRASDLSSACSGFCTQKINAKLATLKTSSDLDRVTDALVYSLLNYASVIVFGWFSGIKVPNVYDAVKADKIDLAAVGFTPAFIWGLFGASLFWGFVIGIADDQDWLY
jgi:hypothetical protein